MGTNRCIIFDETDGRSRRGALMKSECCKAEVIRWFGNVTGVMVGQKKLGKGTMICMKCNKPTKVVELKKKEDDK